MPSVHTTITFTVADADARIDRVMEELLALEGGSISDTDMSAAWEDQRVTVSVVAADDDFDHAVWRAYACIRAAIHASGGDSASWVAVESTSTQLQAA